MDTESTLSRSRKKYTRSIKEKAIAKFGGICKCCGENRVEFLTLSHPNNDGHEHRKSLFKDNNNRGGFSFYQKILKNHNPNYVLEVLCWNCNNAIANYGSCPHKKAATTGHVAEPLDVQATT